MLQSGWKLKARSGSHNLWLLHPQPKGIWGEIEYLQMPMSIPSWLHYHSQLSPQPFHYSSSIPDHSFLMCYQSHPCDSGKDLPMANDVPYIILLLNFCYPFTQRPGEHITHKKECNFPPKPLGFLCSFKGITQTWFHTCTHKGWVTVIKGSGRTDMRCDSHQRPPTLSSRLLSHGAFNRDRKIIWFFLVLV